MKKSEVRIAYIGGGSTGWAPILMHDLALDEDICARVCLYDIDYQGSLRNEMYGNRLQKREWVKSSVTYKAVRGIAEALHGADFVFCSITPAPLSFMRHDLELPRKYGILQTVGDTVGPGGILRSMRSVPIYEAFAHASKRYCPKAWIINYTNPMTVLTRTLTRVEPSLKVFGCCHEVFGTQHLLAGMAEKKLGLKKPVPREEIATNVLGINHFTWIDRAEWNGMDLLKLAGAEMNRGRTRRSFTSAEVKRQLKKGNNEPWAVNNRQVTWELFHRYNILPAAGDRHLAEFVPGFLANEKEMHRWGIIDTTVKFRLGMVQKRIRNMRNNMRNPDFRPHPSGEEGVRLVKALRGLGDIVTNVNLENRGQVANLPQGAVVETNALFSKDRVKPLNAGPLPAGVLGLVSRHALNQELLVEGCLKRDLNLCFQAFRNDPLMALPMDRARKLFDEMTFATKPYLKGYK